MNVFELRDRLVRDYRAYTQGFVEIADDRIRGYAQRELDEGLLWPEPLIQLNPSFEPGASIEMLSDESVLHDECRKIFRIKTEEDPSGKALRLHRHQEEAIRIARDGHDYVLTTGTGSGKSLSYIVPIVDHVLRRGSGNGIQAIIVYPMNALANSQLGELDKFINLGYADRRGPITFQRYTGQEDDEKRNAITMDPPDILLTNFVMLEYILTRPQERSTLVRSARGLRFLVLDELHTYRGRQGADVAMLVRRVRDALDATEMRCVGTSATLATTGSFEAQQQEVAAVATKMFGTSVQPKHVIGETLRRSTEEPDVTNPVFVKALRRRLSKGMTKSPTTYEAIITDPLVQWIESAFGLSRDGETDRLVRKYPPRAITGDLGAAHELADLAGVDEHVCAAAIKEALMAGYRFSNPDTGSPVFAFRLHQFMSRGDTIYASLESGATRHVTVHAQHYVPGDRSRLLLPMVFCRECGQEYYLVGADRGPDERIRGFTARRFQDRLADEDTEAGYLYSSVVNPWPDDIGAQLARVPEDWLDERGRVRRDRLQHLPALVEVMPDGTLGNGGLRCHYIAAPFRFCLSCGVAYGFRQTSDFAKLTLLGSEGRSSATTILSLAAVSGLRSATQLEDKAKKLLSFTDNRQDASLQSGHFNDFFEVGLLRGALYKAVAKAGASGVRHDELTQQVFDALALPFELFAGDAAIRPYAREDTNRAFRDVIGYRLYRDLRRGWRVIAPNLEQCGLLEIRYRLLDEVCRDEELWVNTDERLADADPGTRYNITKVLLDFLRRSLAIRVDYLDKVVQERIQQRSNQHLREPWAIDESERMEHATVVFPRSRRPGDFMGHTYLSGRGGFGQYLRRQGTFPSSAQRPTLDETETIIRQLLEALRAGGRVEAVDTTDDVPGYQIPASTLVWIAGDGTRAFHDPISVPSASDKGGRTNPFFVEFYRDVALGTKGIVAHEHTAQVPYEVRVEREDRFKKGSEPGGLPVLYCSPTMELGVDISELNVVNMRNVPPTPANYAQRSGRAGRSGQPALVFTYCSTGSSHDQYFFKRPERMVAGAVTPPRLDLTNEDLVRAHVHAVWLAETGLSLGSSLKDVLDLHGESPSLELQPHVVDATADEGARDRARVRAKRLLDTIHADLSPADWYSGAWLNSVFEQCALSFDEACNRWRGLYRAARDQWDAQNRVISDHARPIQDKERAKRLRREAEAQLELLTESRNVVQSDFYSYRYFASEGFLPGYNFPRLPLSAFVPGRRRGRQDEFISRPRFLAISEFGPRAFLYHEGSRYIINKVIMPPRDEQQIATAQAKQCGVCGYLHPVHGNSGADRCERCGTALEAPLRSLFRLQNVGTRRRDRINSDEEERLRLGYDLRTGIRFAEFAQGPSYRTAMVRSSIGDLLRLTYGQAATLWRINLGWRRRKDKSLHGFVLDTERGYWQRNEQLQDDDPDDPLSPMTARVVPFVEDRRNCLLVEPCQTLSDAETASLQAALKTAIQVQFQLEENELAAEPLPSPQSRKLILLYESAEGGAGVLRRLLDDASTFAAVAREALALCHFDPVSGEDLRRAPGMSEDCEAACYSCLMSYGNQPDHPLLDRQCVAPLLSALSAAHVDISPTEAPRAEHLEQLVRSCGSALEERWLRFLEQQKLRLPGKAQVYMEECGTRPDFLYPDRYIVIYVDGPPHDYPERQVRDREQTECLEDLGYTVVRFGHEDDWGRIVERYPNVFGNVRSH